MADKVMPGASREALGFLTAHWKSLAQISALPMLAYVLVIGWQIQTLAGLYRVMGNMTVNGQMDPAFFGSYMSKMALTSLAGFLAFCLLGVMFAQIVRFHKTGVAGWLPADGAGWKAGLMTLLYGIGMVMLTMLAYVGAVLVFAIVMVIAALIFGNGVVMIVAMVLGTIGLVIGLYWFLFRFLVGLPGVALGHSPDFFKDIWPLARGEGFALPLRVIVGSLLAYVPVTLIMLVFGGSAFMDFVGTMSQMGGSEDPAVLFPVLADLMERMVPLSIVSVVVTTPIIWFMTLLMAIAFQRFKAKV